MVTTHLLRISPVRSLGLLLTLSPSQASTVRASLMGTILTRETCFLGLIKNPNFVKRKITWSRSAGMEIVR